MKKLAKIPSVPVLAAGFSRALALDLGSQLGWCYTDYIPAQSFYPDLSKTCGMYKLKGTKKETWGVRFVRLKAFLDTIAPTILFFESVPFQFKSNMASRNYGGLLAVTALWCEEHKVKYIGLDVSAIKKYATGKGNADKAEMIKSANKRFALGLNPKREKQESDIADAVHILSLGMYQTYGIQIFADLQPTI